MGIFILLFVPLFVSLCFYIGSIMFFKGKYTYFFSWKEFLVQVVVVSILMTGGYFASRYQAISDTEIWNANVEKKTKEKVSCEHSYPCHCRSVSCGKNCTTMHCDTCYEHFYDISWFVYTTAGEHFNIERVDRQGLKEPARWTAVKLGDPTALPHSFQNYIKANPWSLLNKTEEYSRYQIPPYPLSVYDYHYVDRFVHGDTFPEVLEWNRSMQVLNSSLGVEKQVNIIVVVTKESEAFSYALQNVWLGGKKNDLIVVIGSKDGHVVDWARVISWSHSEVLKVEVRDALIEMGNLDDRAAIIAMLQDKTQRGFMRMNMEDYKYLMAGMEPSATVMWILLAVGVLISGGLSWYFMVNDPFDDNY